MTSLSPPSFHPFGLQSQVLACLRRFTAGIYTALVVVGSIQAAHSLLTMMNTGVFSVGNSDEVLRRVIVFVAVNVVNVLSWLKTHAVGLLPNQAMFHYSTGPISVRMCRRVDGPIALAGLLPLATLPATGRWPFHQARMVAVDEAQWMPSVDITLQACRAREWRPLSASALAPSGRSRPVRRWFSRAISAAHLMVLEIPRRIVFVMRLDRNGLAAPAGAFDTTQLVIHNEPRWRFNWLSTCRSAGAACSQPLINARASLA